MLTTEERDNLVKYKLERAKDRVPLRVQEYTSAR